MHVDERTSADRENGGLYKRFTGVSAYNAGRLRIYDWPNNWGWRRQAGNQNLCEVSDVYPEGV